MVAIHYGPSSYIIWERFDKTGRSTIARNKDGWFTLCLNGEIVSENRNIEVLKSW